MTAEPDTLAPALQSCHPDASVHIVPDAGHWVQFEAPDTVNSLMGAWLSAP